MLDPVDRQQLNALIQKADALDRKLAYLFRHLGIEYRDERPPPDEIEQMVIQGDRLGAMKLLQARRGVGIAEAKRAVDEMAAKLGL
jgi:hypothetical protein